MLDIGNAKHGYDKRDIPAIKAVIKKQEKIINDPRCGDYIKDKANETLAWARAMLAKLEA